MELLITAFIIGLLVYGLERNRIRQSQPHPHLAGSNDITDRDAERVTCELLFRDHPLPH